MTYSYPPQFPSDQRPVEPTVPRGGLALGDIFSGTFRTYRAALGLFLKVVLMPIVLAFAVVLVFTLVMVGWALSSGMALGDSTTPNWGVLALAFLLYIVAVMAVSVLQYVYYGRGMVAAVDLGEGRMRPTWQNLKERTQGLFGRVIALALLVFGIVIGFYVLTIVVVGIATGGFQRTDAGSMGILMFVLVMVLTVAALWLSVKVIYTLVCMAEEGLGAMDALRRSFELTRGAFWKTLGYALVGGLVIYAAMMVVYLPAIPLMGSLDASTSQPSGTTIVFLLVYSLVFMVAVVLLSPVQMIWTALMYLARRRELAGETVRGPQFGPFAGQPGQYPYGAPGQAPQYGTPGAPPYSGTPGGQAPPSSAPYPPPGTHTEGGANPWARPTDDDGPSAQR